MAPFANMFVDVMSLGPRNYAGRVDGTNGTGHGAPTTYIRSGYLFLAEFRPDAYYDMRALISPRVSRQAASINSRASSG